jgi:hypothetical protein
VKVQCLSMSAHNVRLRAKRRPMRRSSRGYANV